MDSAATTLSSPAQPPRGRGRKSGKVPRLGPGGAPALVPVVLVVVWQLATFFVSESALPTPLATGRAFVDGVRDGWLTTNLWATLQVVLAAFAIAAAGGLAVGVWLGLQRFWGDVLGAPLLWSYALPKITIFPIFLLIFGLGDASRMAFGAFHGFFPLAILVLGGINAIPRVYLRAARSLHLSRWTTVTRVVFPAALPSVLSGLRFCFSLCFLGVVLAEMFGSSEGAGYELIRRITLRELPEIFALALSLMAISLLLNLLMLTAERRLVSHGTATTRRSNR
ncbi:ABC transporter permease [Qaidamihabitans albus]|uniref:ABC transporter permease n=1 Tax=Qaidamihabitans albus TaxID=2795733 RepID=UPI001B357554|nr:ABC transporter permease subunit [Qaidamihabitans albus]